MPEYERTKPRDWNERAYRALLRLYPHRFREAYGDAMVEFFRDRLRDMRRTHGMAGVAATWGNALADALRQAPLARVDATRRAFMQLASPPPRAAITARRKDWMLHSIMQDLSLGLRSMLRSPWHSSLVILTLALGLGANTAIYSVVDHTLLRPLPFHDPDALLQIRMQDPYLSVSEPEFADLRRDARTLSGVVAYAGGTTTLASTGSEPERARVSRVSDGFFPVLGVPAALGRTFTADEERAGGPRVAVLSHATWQRRFGGDPGEVGRTVQTGDEPVTVVGVMPASFRFPPGGGAQDDGPALWLPLRLRYDSLWTRNNHYMTMIARMKPGVTRDGVVAEVAGITARWSKTFTETYAPDQPIRGAVLTLQESLLGSTRPYLLSLLGAVGFVLLIACVNVANLQLVRAEARRKDAAIRSALGASRLRLARQGITENLLYALIGGALGLAVAWWGVRALVLLAPADMPRMTNVGIDATVLLFSAGVALLTGLALGVAPAVADRERDTSETLKEGGKTSSSAARSAGRARRRLVTAEIALAVTMLSGAALMVRSLMRMQAIDVGFQPEGVATMSLLPSSAPAGTTDAEASARLVSVYRELLLRVRALPGVTAAAAASEVPMADGVSSWSILLDGAPATTIANAPAATPAVVTPGYFEALGIELVRGRVIGETDGADAPPVVVINESMARRHWAGQDPVGHSLRMFSDAAPWVTIVGVVRDVKVLGFTQDPPPIMYFPHAQSGRTAYFTPRAMSLLVRTAGAPSAVLPSLRRVVRELEPMAPIARETTVDLLVDASVGARRFATTLIVTFAGLALLLAGIGIYGVISTSVAQRSYEIGVRMALGARRADVMSMIMREGLRTALIGAGLGLAGALSSTFLLRSIIYDVKAWDPLSLGAAVVSLLVVVLVACSIPAARATAVDPNRALRAE